VGDSLRFSASRIGRVRVCLWHSVGTVNLGPCAPSPHLSFYLALHRGGPQPRTAEASLIKARIGVGSVIGPSPWRSIPTFSPSILSYTLNLNLISWCLFHYRSVQRACLVMAVSTIRLTATMHLSILKQTLFWALSIQKS
jgi:hypothetical protein